MWHKKDETGPPPVPTWDYDGTSKPLHPLFPSGVSTGAVTPFVAFYGLFEFEVWGVEQDLIPFLEKLEPSSVSVDGWVIDPYIHSLLDCPSEVL